MESNSPWVGVNDAMLPWSMTISSMMSDIVLPPMNGNTLYITTDTGGLHKGSRYETISILIFDMDNSPKWPEQIRELRRNMLPDNRRMSFKDLNDNLKMRALSPFLLAADSLSGVCISIGINKSIKGLLGDREAFNRWQSRLNMESIWNFKSFRMMSQLAYFVAFFVAGISHEKQEILWISDEDDAFGNCHRKQDVGRIMINYLYHFSKHVLGQVYIGTTEIDPGDKGEEDLASIPDLVAGASAELLTAMARFTGRIPSVDLGFPLVSEKTDAIIDWFTSRNKMLSKIGIVIDEFDNNHTRLGRWTVCNSPMWY